MSRGFLRNGMRLGLAALVLAIAASGCWGSTETDQLAIVGSIGVDTVTPGKVLLTLEVTNPGALASGLGQDGGNKVVGWVLAEESSTLPNAVNNVQRRTPKRIFMGQVSTIIFGMNLAREGVSQYLDYFARENLFRRSVFIATCDSAAGLLQRPLMEDLPSLTLRGLIQHSLLSGRTVQVTLNEFLLRMSEPGIEPITMHTAGRDTRDLRIKRQGEEVRQQDPSMKREQPLESEKNLPAMLPPDSPALDPLTEHGMAEALPDLTMNLGIAVFRGDRLVGFLDGNDARGYLWVDGRVASGAIIEVTYPPEDGVLGMRLKRLKSSVSPILDENDMPRVEVKVSIELEASQLLTAVNVSDAKVRKIVEGRIAKQIKQEILGTLRIVQEEFKSDIYGFGQAFYRRYPAAWEGLVTEWNETVFPELQVEVTVRSRIFLPGAIMRET